MSDLKNQLIKLGSKNPELRGHLRPVLDRISGRDKMARASGLKRRVIDFKEEVMEEVMSELPSNYEKYHSQSEDYSVTREGDGGKEKILILFYPDSSPRDPWGYTVSFSNADGSYAGGEGFRSGDKVGRVASKIADMIKDKIGEE